MTLLARAQGLSEVIEREADRSESDATLLPSSSTRCTSRASSG